MSTPGKFDTAFAKATEALEGDHIGKLELAAIRQAHRQAVAEVEQAAEADRELLQDLLLKVQTVREMEQEFSVLKNELNDRQGKGPDRYFVGLSIGILTEMFKELDLEEIPCAEEIGL